MQVETTLQDQVIKAITLLKKNYDSCSKEFIGDTFKIRESINFICNYEQLQGKYYRLKEVIVKLLDEVEKNNDQEKYAYYYCIFQEAERLLVKKGKNLVRIFNNDYSINASLEKHYYSKRITTAIFWVVEDKWLIFKPIWLLNNKEDKRTHKIDCPYSHYEWWDKYKKDYPGSDFATFPRGRIMFDLAKKEHVIFYDQCIRKAHIRDILDLFQIKKYRVEYDEHYSCDKCVQNKELF